MERYLERHGILDEELVRTTCKIMNYVQDGEFDAGTFGEDRDLVTGMCNVMSNLIVKWPYLESFLKVVFNYSFYSALFLRLLSKWDEWKFKDLTIIDQFLSCLKEKDEMKGRSFVWLLYFKITSKSVGITKEDIKMIKTAETLFNWITEAKNRI